MQTVAQLMDLSGRKALITGGAGHIGLAAAETLLELGARVAVLDLDRQACEKRVEELSRFKSSRAVAIPCNLTDEASTRGAVRDCVERLKGLDILIHCAAYVGTTEVPGWAVPFEEQAVSAWDAALRVNLTSAFILVQEAREALSASGHGSVIVLASIYGSVGPDMRLYEGTPMQNPVGYAASKGGLIQLTRHLATLLAPQVRVNAISPGGVWRNQPEAFHARYCARTPLKRMAKEVDLKGAVAYLASDLSSYVTGHNLTVDGGWTAW
ncbi:MAG: SDR family oxidoreductase [Candidatus Omnitrophica bacterium]|nr:SDR family oxidoreductase [Candidatus Omnitrophota bacterium]